jgi:antitoxin component YwqK of YwqJK toxin-antitoxin module
MVYNNGKIEGYKREWHENGTLKFECFFIKGMPEGLRKSWYDNGQVEEESIYENGDLIGKQVKWHPNGNLKSRADYRRGSLHGIKCIWYEDGQLSFEGTYDSNQLHGIVQRWHRNGKLMSREDYTQNQLSGICCYWEEDGRLRDRRIYIRGTLLGGWVADVIKKGTLNAEHILKIRNAEVRRVCMEELSYEKFLIQVEHKVIDRDNDYELVRIDCAVEPEPIYLVKVKCPSTGAFYTLRVPPRIKSVKQAVAWTFGLEAKEYVPEIET